MLRKFSAAYPPTQEDAYEWYRHGLARGLSPDAAWRYALLLYYGGVNELEPPEIISGYRSRTDQAELQRRWDRGDRRGLRVRPVTTSRHTARTAFDLQDLGDLRTFGEIAPHLGLRWGGRFAERDDVHFDLGR